MQWNRHFGEKQQMNIITELQEMLHPNHAHVSIFKYALKNIDRPDHRATIRADMNQPENMNNTTMHHPWIGGHHPNQPGGW